jgi:hypothetical protein
MRQIINVSTGEVSTIEEAAPSFPPPAQPREIHIAWFKAALADLGHLDAVEAAVATLPAAKRIMWEYATSIGETDADVIAIAGALKIDLAAVFDRAEAIRSGKFGA